MVFWLGWGKKIKDSVDKLFVKQNYLSKTDTPLQTINSKIDFRDNGVFKKELFVDVVGAGRTNVPNMEWIRANDTLGVFRIYISNYNEGRFNLEWIKKPSLWNNNDIAIEELHLNTTYTEVNRGDNVRLTTSQGFQGWNNVRVPGTAQSNQLNNATFKDNIKNTKVYWFMRLHPRLGGRTLKLNTQASFTFEKQYLEWTVVVNYTPPTKQKPEPIKYYDMNQDTFFSMEERG